MKLAILILAALPLCAQQSVTLHVSGQIQSAKTSAVNFGRLRKGLRAADWTVTSNSTVALKIPIARILQEIHSVPGISILSRISSTSAVEDAQGRSLVGAIGRIGMGGIGTLATCEGIKLCGTGGSWGTAVFGAEIGALLIQGVLPTLPTHALQSITAMLPDPVVLDPFGTASGMIIVELSKKAPEPGPLDEMITVLIAK